MSPLPLAPVRVMVVLAVLSVAAAARAADDAAEAPATPPPFPSARAKDWIGKPQSWDNLRGQVVLLDLWRYACSSCRATVPWIKDVRQRYAEPRAGAGRGAHARLHLRARARQRRVGGAPPRPRLPAPARQRLRVHGRAGGEGLAHRVPRRPLRPLRETEMGEVHAKDESAQRLEARIEALLAEPVSAVRRPPPPRPPMIFGPTFAEMRDPSRIRPDVREKARAARARPLDPLNLYNLSLEGGRRACPYTVLPEALTGVCGADRGALRPPLPDRLAQGRPRLLDPGREAGRRAVRARRAHARVPLHRQLRDRRRVGGPAHGLPLAGRPAGGDERRALREDRRLRGGGRGHARLGVERQGDLRQGQGAARGARTTAC